MFEIKTRHYRSGYSYAHSRKVVKLFGFTVLVGPRYQSRDPQRERRCHG
ncbi:hypothetical protein UFOVP131_12 [uncultured Caudovirales phage]|uniref:Uncharacterized protein n=1 Tax=uncultured Caudovirales phage TaxID=2100421 RepID=A0A6J5LBM5_9CAUD|nr:hypothetical protein UFOVP131_12 [uncultured Caudovirales phage]